MLESNIHTKYVAAATRITVEVKRRSKTALYVDFGIITGVAGDDERIGDRSVETALRHACMLDDVHREAVTESDVGAAEERTVFNKVAHGHILVQIHRIPAVLTFVHLDVMEVCILNPGVTVVALRTVGVAPAVAEGTEHILKVVLIVNRR